MSDVENMLCPICKRADIVIVDRKSSDYGKKEARVLDCPCCGRFGMRWHEHFGYPNVEQKDGLALSKMIRFNKGRLLTIETSEDAHTYVSNLSVPKNAIEQMESALNVIANEAPNLGQHSETHDYIYWTTVCMMPNCDGTPLLFQELIDLGLIKCNTVPSEDIVWSAYLTIKGWEKVGTINKKMVTKNAFVAMWFHQDLNEVYDNGIAPILRKLGWNPIRIDREHFTNRIDDEILRKINDSSLMIADVTGARHGVYFEAGFALGQGKPVIWLCNSSWRTRIQIDVKPNDISEVGQPKECGWMDALHFDTKTYPHIAWESTQDLAEKLENRLLALNLNHNG